MKTRLTHARANVRDLEKAIDWARLSHRVEVVEPIFDTAYGTRKFTICDPDGNELGFVQDEASRLA